MTPTDCIISRYFEVDPSTPGSNVIMLVSVDTLRQLAEDCYIDALNTVEDDYQSQLAEEISNAETRGYNRGYADATEEVSDEQYNKGYDQGFDEGHDKGYGQGYDQGYDAGHDKGYGQGYDQACADLKNKAKNSTENLLTHNNGE